MQAGCSPTGFFFFFLLLNKTWANEECGYRARFSLSCCCNCFKNTCFQEMNSIKANLKIPESSWPRGTEGNNTSHREIRSFSQTHKIQIQPLRGKYAQTAESSKFCDRQTHDFNKIHTKKKEDFYFGTREIKINLKLLTNLLRSTFTICLNRCLTVVGEGSTPTLMHPVKPKKLHLNSV